MVVLRGSGRAFSAGRDVSEAPTPAILALVQDVARAIVGLSKPVVAAVHGWVVGAGVEWMLDADIVVAARSARFKLPEVGLGVFVTGGIMLTLPHYAGLARAKGLLLLGEEFSAADALQWGLVWTVVDDAALDAEVARIAARLAGFDPRAICRFSGCSTRSTSTASRSRCRPKAACRPSSGAGRCRRQEGEVPTLVSAVGSIFLRQIGPAEGGAVGIKGRRKAAAQPATTPLIRTTSKCSPVTCRSSLTSASLFQRSSGAPLTYQLLPWSATIMPCVCIAVSSARVSRLNEAGIA